MTSPPMSSTHRPAPILAARELDRTHGRTRALRGAAVELCAGEILAVTGASGSGKSTLLHCVRAVLGRALILETALPLAPAMLVAGLGGAGICVWYATVPEGTHAVPLLPLLVPVAVYAACLLAAATSLPLLGRSVRPAELRFA